VARWAKGGGKEARQGDFDSRLERITQIMKQKKNIVRALLVFGIGALLTYVGIAVPQKDIEQVVDVVTEYSTPSTEDTPAPTTQMTFTAEIASVTDGDTVVVFMGGTKEHVRVLGINTPETKYSNRGAECFGAEASTYAKTLLRVGDTITLTPDPTQDARDKYNRILAYITLPDGRDLGELMIQRGYAREYTFKGRTYQKQVLYKELQTKAEGEGMGLWSACNADKL